MMKVCNLPIVPVEAFREAEKMHTRCGCAVFPGGKRSCGIRKDLDALSVVPPYPPSNPSPRSHLHIPMGRG